MKESLEDLIEEQVKKYVDISYTRSDQIPDIALYMDQVTTFMEDSLNTTRRNEDDKIMTKTMINNYAKNKLIPPPVKKKYNKEQIVLLMFIYYYKNLFSITDINTILEPVIKHFYTAEDLSDGRKSDKRDEKKLNKKNPAEKSEAYNSNKISVSIAQIYDCIWELLKENEADFSDEMEKYKELAKEVVHNESIAGNIDEEDKTVIEIFSLINLLSYDIYRKQQFIFGLIDSIKE
ncbi:MAG: DUF1836 domain-containing protein [Lachnospiraceae bacterium]|nr:DUF1836 domain-containing protein [Lachnospiraceae bacterium]